MQIEYLKKMTAEIYEKGEILMDGTPIVIKEKKKIKNLSEKTIKIYFEILEYLDKNFLFLEKKQVFAQKIYLILLYVLISEKLQNINYNFKWDISKVNKDTHNYTIWQELIVKKISSRDLIDYFNGNEIMLTDNFTSHILNELFCFINEQNYVDILFYVMEIFEYVYENDERVKKRNEGIYYTPKDVVDYITKMTIDSYINHLRYISLSLTQKKELLKEHCFIADISCGTGIFLAIAVERLMQFYDDLDMTKCDKLISIFKNNIFGIDISEYAVETTKMLLMISSLSIIIDGNYTFGKYYNILNSNIRVGDSVTVISDSKEKGNKNMFKDYFPMVFKYEGGFNCIIGNPPYSSNNTVYNQNIIDCYVSYTSTSYDKKYLFFLENLMYLSANKSVSGLVIPLSLAYNKKKPFISLRNSIEKDSANWKFAFFDRSPDSLFGDDVKTRNIIVIRDNFYDKFQLETTSLTRWSSKERDKLFDNISYEALENITIKNKIPKIGNALEKEVYSKLDNNNSLFKSNLSEGENIIYYYPTAYNWLPFFIEKPPCYDLNHNEIESSVKIIKTGYDKYLIYSLLSSTISYWLWIIEGDIFHFSSSFIREFPYDINAFSKGEIESLKLYGLELWLDVKKHKVSSNNAGKIVINYSYIYSFNIIEKINAIVINAFELPKEFNSYLKKWYFELIRAGRTNFKYDQVIYKMMEEQNN